MFLKPLSKRETEVLDLLVRAVPQKEIAARLGISVKTVGTFVSSAKRKGQFKSLTELVVAVSREQGRAEVRTASPSETDPQSCNAN